MVGIILQILRLATALYRGFHDKELQGLAILTFLLITSGSIFYVNMEGWTYLDSIYFCVATLTTVGYGDLTPQTTIGKLFTILYMIGGVGVGVAFVAKIALFSLRGREAT